jgi:hypothetical protein
VADLRVCAPLEGAPNSLLIASATSVVQSDGVNMSGVTWRTMSQPHENSELTYGQVAAALLTQPYVYQAEQAGVYPLSTVTASIQRTADLMTSVGMIRKQLNVASMIAR